MDSAPSVLDEVLGDSLLSCSLPHAAPVEVRPELAMLDYLRDLPLRSDFQTLIMANCAPVDRYFIPLCTSSTAQGGGGSFKNRKRIGEIDCCE